MSGTLSEDYESPTPTFPTSGSRDARWLALNDRVQAPADLLSYDVTSFDTVPPGKRRPGGMVQVIRYCCAASTIGRMLVATTGRGVCSVAFAGTDDLLRQEVRGRFRTADVWEDDASLEDEVRAVLATLAGHSVTFELPFDVRATAFQKRVWQTLQAIPRGETRTYRQVAESLGQPTACRAVARACASNPLAVVVPCHRVVGSGGALTGYRWGLERKQMLLQAERLDAAQGNMRPERPAHAGSFVA